MNNKEISLNSTKDFSYFLISMIFLKFLALIYLIAFISLWVQVIGLIGGNGILPVHDYLESVRLRLGPLSFWFLPTLCWFNASDVFLHFLCGVGAILSILILFNMSPIVRSVILFFLWLIYLSLVTVSRDFLGFQWDNLLLETGFLSIFLPSTSRPLFVWLLRLLLFKLMFFSGVVKLLSGDPAWRNLTALTYHYLTQPLPNVISYYVYWLPVWFHKLSCFLMFVMELVVPFFIFLNRKLRICSCIVLVIFQVLIMITGNYCFFNLLTIALCLFLLEDDIFSGWIRIENSHGKSLRWHNFFVYPLIAIILIVNIMLFARLLQIQINWPLPFKAIYSWVSPFRTINSYGLFAIMTTTRPEIIMEGSNDGMNWFAYEFKYKPGDLKSPPLFVAPHQPRLDWQMWFAALGNYQSNPWFVSLCIRLLQGSKDVIKLIDKNPFPDSPPKYIRALFYDYHFSDFGKKEKTGEWWRRELKGLYFPPVILENDRLRIAQVQN